MVEYKLMSITHRAVPKRMMALLTEIPMFVEESNRWIEVKKLEINTHKKQIVSNSLYEKHKYLNYLRIILHHLTELKQEVDSKQEFMANEEVKLACRNNMNEMGESESVNFLAQKNLLNELSEQIGKITEDVVNKLQESSTKICRTVKTPANIL